MFRLAAIALAICLSSVIVSAQRKTPASKAELDQITARGTKLAAYENAVLRASYAVAALAPVTSEITLTAPPVYDITALSSGNGSITSYVAVNTNKGWVVVFGHFDEAGDKFLITYQADQRSTSNEFKASKIDPPKEDTGFYFHAAKAIGIVMKDFKLEEITCIAALLPAKPNRLYVYIIPVSVGTVTYVGGDARYLVSADGARIIEKRQMHIAISQFPLIISGISPKEWSHEHELDNCPEDSDVSYVLSRRPSIPEWVVTRKFVYYIRADGTIKYSMTTDAYNKRGKDRLSQVRP